MNKPNGHRLLGVSDGSPINWINPHAVSSVALVCEHAGNAVPAALGNLGLSADQLQEHIAIDVGARATADRLSHLLEAPLLTQHYSRLVIDCNRPTQAPDSIPEISHGTVVPGNKALDVQQRHARIEEIFTPYDNALYALTEAQGRQFAFSIHSFTATLNKLVRPWDIGLLYRHDSHTSIELQRYINAHYPDLTVGLNQPYQVDDESDWFIPRHAERLGLKHSLVEIRNDHIQSAAGQEHMATVLADAIKHVSAH